MIIIMQRTLEYFSSITSNKNPNPTDLEHIMKLWNGVGPDNMRETNEGIKYVKIEL